MFSKKIITLIMYFIVALSFTAQFVFAVAPSKDVISKLKQDGVYDEKMAILRDFHKRGGCSPVENIFKKGKNSLAAGNEAVVDTVNVVVLLVQFSDHLASEGEQFGSVADFDSILFSRSSDLINNPSGSMTDFYLENSYGNFYIKGDIYGWYTMPESYAYYTNNESGLGTYPTNSQRLTEDAIQIADNNGVDFSKYDFNNDGDCDGVILIHSGPGFETSGLTTDIWSHKWSIPRRFLDGVWIENYNMNPEEYITSIGTTLSPIGVFCHEYGHFLGLPDLYDTSDTTRASSGLGEWSLMAKGNYNGPSDNSRYPAHFDPWCKSQIGFINLVDVTDNLYNVEIPQIETTPTAYRLRNAITGPSEYFIVENRQQVGFDEYLPSSGLLIYHIDETQGGNTDSSHYKVALEQADNLNDLAFTKINDGDLGDPFPGSTVNREFQQFTAPNSQLYSSTASQIGVWNISNSDSIMTADLDVAYSRPWIESFGATPFIMADADSDGILEPGETVQFFFSIQNQMRITENVHATLSSDNPALQFTQNNITVPGSFTAAILENPLAPIIFTIPDTISPRIDSFFLTITTDSLDASLNPIAGSVTHTKTFGFEFTIGQPNILIVDADRGENYELNMENALYNKRVPTDIWDKDNNGTPNIGDLAQYDMVFWHTGADVDSGAVDAADIAVMKQYMDNGKNLMLSTVRGIDEIMNIDSTLLIDYFHARRDAQVYNPGYNGIVGNPVGEGLSLVPGAAPLGFFNITTLVPVGSGSPAFTSGGQICGVTYDGSYKSVLVTFAAELLDNEIAGYSTQSDFIEKVVNFFGGISTDIYDGNPYARIPNSFDLSQNYPNPFNPTTTIRYTIRPTDEIGAVTRLDVFNMMGQKVITLVDEAQIPGNYEVQWDGVNSNHQEVASGMYFYRLTRGSEYSSKKMTLLK